TDWFLLAGAEAEEIALNTFFPISDEMEIEAGQSIHEDFDYTFIEDARTQKLRNMLDEMRPFISRDLDYKIFLIEDDVINAWTIPGGYIYVTTGIMDFIQSDDELANVIGHEIGHNENKHTTKIIQRNAPRNIHPDISVVVDVYSLATMAYNQPQELEADQSGFYLSYKAGYNPRRGLDFWKRLAEFENPNFLEKLFRSHPYSAARYQCGQDYLDQAKMD
ncbi:MAG: M48 family metallopeptidase, partial [Phaeodactylibacter sp.]|nr:M48 family metallopeptidase [Phaeodactylibacter sp.]